MVEFTGRVESFAAQPRTPWGPSLNTSASAMYRFDPRRHTIAFHASNSLKSAWNYF